MIKLPRSLKFPVARGQMHFLGEKMKTKNAPKLSTHREDKKDNFSTLAFLLVGWILFLGRVGRRPQIRTLNLTSTLPSLIMYIHNNLIFHDSLNETQLNYFTCEFNCECWRTTILHSHNELFTDFCCNRRSVTPRRTWRPLQNTVNPGVVTKIWCTWFRNNLCSILRSSPKNKKIKLFAIRACVPDFGGPHSANQTFNFAPPYL